MYEHFWSVVIIGLTALAGLGGSYLGSYMKKKGENLATQEDIDKLVTQIRVVTTATKEIETKFTSQIEAQKAFLLRSSNIHDRQVTALLAIHYKLERGTSALQTVANFGKPEGQLKDEDLLQMAQTDLKEAFEKYSENKLLMTVELVQKLDDFFNKIPYAHLDLVWAMNPQTPDTYKGEAWKKAQESIFKEIPSVLRSIDAEARSVIHGLLGPG